MTRFTPNGLQAYTAITAVGAKITFHSKDDVTALMQASRIIAKGAKLYRGDISIADAPNHTPIREIA